MFETAVRRVRMNNFSGLIKKNARKQRERRREDFSETRSAEKTLAKMLLLTCSFVSSPASRSKPRNAHDDPARYRVLFVALVDVTQRNQTAALPSQYRGDVYTHICALQREELPDIVHAAGSIAERKLRADIARQYRRRQIFSHERNLQFLRARL